MSSGFAQDMAAAVDERGDESSGGSEISVEAGVNNVWPRMRRTRLVQPARDGTRRLAGEISNHDRGS